MSECDGCRFPGLKLKTYPAPPFDSRGRTEPFKFCELCAATFIGNAVQYPDQYEDAETMRLIGYCANLILKEIRRLP